MEHSQFIEDFGLPIIGILIFAFGIVAGLNLGYTVASRRKLIQRVEWLESLLRDLYRDANPTILDDADTGVRLPPRWNERIKAEIQDEKEEETR